MRSPRSLFLSTSVYKLNRRYSMKVDESTYECFLIKACRCTYVATMCDLPRPPRTTVPSEGVLARSLGRSVASFFVRDVSIERTNRRTNVLLPSPGPHAVRRTDERAGGRERRARAGSVSMVRRPTDGRRTSGCIAIGSAALARSLARSRDRTNERRKGRKRAWIASSSSLARNRHPFFGQARERASERGL